MKLGKNASWKPETVIQETTTKNVGNANEILGNKTEGQTITGEKIINWSILKLACSEVMFRDMLRLR